ncbi:MAG: hypothetical protein Q8L97_12640, partial [Nitrosomonas sp.]|uniref:hypothetical protein n=1 Tax=Nitrosomonas sp. TaxID=42353 RepID=UPI0027307A0F
MVSVVKSALCRKSRRRNTPLSECDKVECGVTEDRNSNGAYCPRNSVVMGDVIGIGEWAWRCWNAWPISRLIEILESRGFKVFLVNAHHVKNVSGRKSD